MLKEWREGEGESVEREVNEWREKKEGDRGVGRERERCEG